MLSGCASRTAGVVLGARVVVAVEGLDGRPHEALEPLLLGEEALLLLLGHLGEALLDGGLAVGLRRLLLQASGLAQPLRRLLLQALPVHVVRRGLDQEHGLLEALDRVVEAPVREVHLPEVHELGRGGALLVDAHLRDLAHGLEVVLGAGGPAAEAGLDVPSAPCGRPGSPGRAPGPRGGASPPPRSPRPASACGRPRASGARGSRSCPAPPRRACSPRGRTRRARGSSRRPGRTAGGEGASRRTRRPPSRRGRTPRRASSSPRTARPACDARGSRARRRGRRPARRSRPL